jgi:hypothetical protein
MAGLTTTTATIIAATIGGTEAVTVAGTAPGPVLCSTAPSVAVSCAAEDFD